MNSGECSADYYDQLIIARQSDSVRLRSPAKINLILNVLDERPDGYHNLENLMHTINFCDEIEIGLRPSPGIRVRTTNQELPTDLDNLAGKAARSFLNAAGTEVGLDVVIEKCIPAGGGLGGGSSNAAITLLALNDLLGNPLRKKNLEELAISLGSDVPFFLYGGFALCTGKGEEIRQLPLPDEFQVVVVYPEEKVSTARIYELFRKNRLTAANKFSRLVNSGVIFENRSVNFHGLASRLHNDLEGTVESEYPELGSLKDAFRLSGCGYSMVTGSGSCVFGMCESRAQSAGVSSGLRSLLGDGKFLIIEASSRL